MKFLGTGFDHVEFVVHNVDAHTRLYQAMGFEKIGERRSETRGIRSIAWQQGFIRIVLTQAMPGFTENSKEASIQFLKTLNEGVTALAVEVDDAEKAFIETTSRGARPAKEPETFKKGDSELTRAEIYTPGHLRYVFISRNYPRGLAGGGLLDGDFRVDRFESPRPLHLHSIDHLTNNIPMGEMKTWSEFYRDVFQFVVTRHFKIKTGRTGLLSDVVESPCGKIKVPINEATEKESQVQEFVDRLGGAGVQHLAFLTTKIVDTLPMLKKQGIKFLSVPSTYYERVPARVPNVKEDLGMLEKLGLLLDGDDKGYLMQIFSHEMMGPFFFEFIERKGNQGFGEGNFQALFEAIERDQERRGVIPTK